MKKYILISFLFIYHSVSQGMNIWGPEVNVGQGTARSFVEVNKSGVPLSIGVGFDHAALQGLPGDFTEYEVPLPAIVSLPPFTHITMDWEPHGHEPEGVYDLPHFDFHFYMISSAERKAITCQGDDEGICLMNPTPEKTPPFYVPTPAGVPQMGWHWVDPRSPEFNGKVFTTTLIYGFYAGNVSFIEPMVTRDFLEQKKYFEAEVPLAQEMPKPGYYPSRYSVDYQPCHRRYMVRLKNLSWR